MTEPDPNRTTAELTQQVCKTDQIEQNLNLHCSIQFPSVIAISDIRTKILQNAF